MTFGSMGLFEEMDRLRQDMDRLLGDRWVRVDLPVSRVAFLPGRSSQAYPLLNLIEEPDRYRLEALAPGLDPEKLDITVTGGQITLSGAKKSLPEGAQSDKNYHRQERAAGEFQRTVSLPGEIDRDGVTAEYVNGVLTVSIPKAAAVRPRSISVSVD